jgi:hypothetical protein
MSANHGQRRIEDTMLSDLLTVYREEGFVVIPDVFSAAELTELRAVSRRIRPQCGAGFGQ